MHKWYDVPTTDMLQETRRELEEAYKRIDELEAKATQLEAENARLRTELGRSAMWDEFDRAADEAPVVPPAGKAPEHRGGRLSTWIHASVRRILP